MQRLEEEICILRLWDRGEVCAATKNLLRSIEQPPYSIQADTIVCCFSLSGCHSQSSSHDGYASSDGDDTPTPTSSNVRQLHYRSHAHMDPGRARLILPGSLDQLEGIICNCQVAFGSDYKQVLLQAFSANSHTLSRFFYKSDVLEILRISTRTFKDPSECTKELITMLKTNTQVLCLMQQQLCEQSRPFEELKLGYFNQFAKCHIKKLLDIAVCLSKTVWSATHICPMLLVYETLMDVLPLIQKFASSESDDFVPNILRNMREAFRRLIGHIKHHIRSNMERHQDDGAIHPMTCFLVRSMKSFGSHRNLVQSTLAPGDNSSSFGHLLYDVITCWKSVLTERSNIYRADLQRQCIFLLNNTEHFNTKTDGLLDELLSDRQIIRQHDDEFKLLFKKWIQSYTEEACTSAKSCLNRNSRWGSQRRSLVAFTSKFNKTFDRQKTWKVPDVVLRQVLRDHIHDCILPDYTRCFENYSSSGLFSSCLQIASAGDIYTTESLEKTVQSFFEG
ncbi:uncharacterized protein LOC119361835 isoform X1 [Triticum dicoccoides]|uniref:uncharacterized protein LOC119361835 isoform X1 n=1 Tax=Triticum dicoccoides TaxID=85692 RepID=UPI000E7B436F|nr:uncharacterized protein LOC119361835 isoform X1 [Triticum dicoccoides]XP_037482878.1 uncharacterized protein LOC119361835 isoform X1 [Triticum dicoccoides]